ncbi:MAG: hypothetical protein M3245_02675, partial [Actinomycetota bacterium]|nr:hypothetical protein [Actinomycetota bacterium]
SASQAAALIDLGGADRYEARVRSEAEAMPTVGGAVESGGHAMLQGSGLGGLLWDRDDGQQDAFVSEPNLEDTCVGHRGEPTAWQECLPAPNEDRTRTLGKGMVDSAPVKGQPALAFDPGQGGSGRFGDVLPVGGRLAGPSGEPLADRYVEIRVQGRFEAGLGIVIWLDASAIHAVTGPDGSWDAMLRLPDGPAFGATTHRLLGLHSGDEALRGARATLPFSLLPG